MNAYLHGISYQLPAAVRTNEDLVKANPSWDAEKIYAKTGIRARHVAAADETAADLGAQAADSLMREHGIDPGSIDVLLFCTQSPDYFAPTSACLLQQRLGLPDTCGALDFNLGCSGFTYGLWMARALIQSQSARRILLVAADTYSKYCDPHDLTTVTIFGDAGTAALISHAPEGALASIGPTVVGTNGAGCDNLIIRHGGARTPAATDAPPRLYMNGPEVFAFTLTAVQSGIQQLLTEIGKSWDDVDLYLLHQANRFMLEKLGKVMRVSAERMPIDMEDIGNTVCATIPILIRRCMDKGTLQPGQDCVLAGFGIGYSWAMTHVQWTGD